ncbi:histidinol-phosphate aminotransferase [Kribbella sp. VKM Ac-2527]|uniref:Aromatic amino acid aminotransferase n=1 Tax=Kribbella caucasensis TaxID=2512215 RepID=A0A4R6KJ27_9ACTN|nr:histidinol-phosphate transaminase [Kribbella sp. VKM Ac-2527]TDO51304.1 histidinol-phosphate aminotransferase [Kribbella sp. VKM Ac-2527]
MTNPALRTAVTDLRPYVPGRRAQSALAAALASNESHYPPLESVLKVVADASGRLNRYPEISSIELRERIAEHVGVTAAEIAVGPGSVGVLQQIITAMCDAGDEVVFAWRSFEAYPIVVGLAGAVAVPVPLRDEGHDLAAMVNAITARTRVVLLCSPNNPTGVAITASELESFLDQVPPQVLVVVDEAYFEYAGTPETALSAYRRHPNVCVLRTFSKAYGLAGLRVGYAIASSELADGLRRTAIPFGVTSIAQQAAIASLDAYDEMRERVVPVIAERRRMTAVLRTYGWSIPDSEANFIWIRTTEALREHLLSAFAAEDILVRGYPNDGIRITVADPESNDRVLRVLRRSRP